MSLPIFHPGQELVLSMAAADWHPDLLRGEGLAAWSFAEAAIWRGNQLLLRTPRQAVRGNGATLEFSFRIDAGWTGASLVARTAYTDEIGEKRHPVPSADVAFRVEPRPEPTVEGATAAAPEPPATELVRAVNLTGKTIRIVRDGQTWVASLPSRRGTDSADHGLGYLRVPAGIRRFRCCDADTGRELASADIPLGREAQAPGLQTLVVYEGSSGGEILALDDSRDDEHGVRSHDLFLVQLADGHSRVGFKCRNHDDFDLSGSHLSQAPAVFRGIDVDFGADLHVPLEGGPTRFYVKTADEEEFPTGRDYHLAGGDTLMFVTTDTLGRLSLSRYDDHQKQVVGL